MLKEFVGPKKNKNLIISIGYMVLGCSVWIGLNQLALADSTSQGVSEAEVPGDESEDSSVRVKPVLYYLIDANRNFTGGLGSGGTFMGAIVNGLDFDLGLVFKNSSAFKDTHFYIDHFAAWGRPSSGKQGDIQLALNSWAPETVRLYHM